MSDKKMPERLSRTTIYESDHVCLYTDRVKLPSGYIIEKYQQIHYPKEAVVVVIFNENDDILFVHNRRYTVGHLEWEIPAGKIEQGESIEAAAKVQFENNILDTDEIGSKKWFSKKEYMELLKNNGTKDGVSILTILFALQFYPF